MLALATLVSSIAPVRGCRPQIIANRQGTGSLDSPTRSLDLEPTVAVVGNGGLSYTKRKAVDGRHIGGIKLIRIATGWNDANSPDAEIAPFA